jgi:esterase
VLDSKFIVINGQRHHYLDWGTAGKPVIVCLHGLRGHAHAWDDLAPSFCETHHVLAFDMRGRGDSDWDISADYSLNAYVQDLGQLLDALHVQACWLVGHSMGALVSMLFAARNPGRLHGAVLMEMGPENDPRGTARLVQEFRRMPEEYASMDEALAVAIEENPYASETVLRKRLEFQTRPLESGRIGWRYDRAIRDLWRGDSRPARPDLWPLLSKMSCPTLIIRGTHTDIFPAAVANRMRQTISQAELVEIPNAAHMVNEENPAACIAAMQAFFNAHQAGQ